MIANVSLTLSLLVVILSSTYILCKQFGPGSGQGRRSLSGSKLFDIEFWKCYWIFEVDFEKSRRKK